MPIGNVCFEFQPEHAEEGSALVAREFGVPDFVLWEGKTGIQCLLTPDEAKNIQEIVVRIKALLLEQGIKPLTVTINT